MKLSIRYRLFLSILAATCVALLCMFLIMAWSINRGFFQYLEAMEQGRIEKVAKSLEKIYAERGNWDFLRQNPGFWIDRLLEGPPHDLPFEPRKEFDRRKELLPPRPPMGPHRPPAPFIILDAGRKPIFGNPEAVKGVHFKPIFHNGEMVGYVGSLPPKEFLHPLQVQFLRQQKTALILSLIGMICVVVLFSLPLANRLVRPIRALAAATRELASGKYTVRVPVSSSGKGSDELGQLGQDFNTMALSLEKNEKARRQWVADISHELRTPLAVLRGEIEALLEGVRLINPEAIRSLHAETLRLHRLVDDLYQLSLSDLGTLTYRKEDLDPAGVLNDSLGPFRAEFNRKSIRVSTDFSSGKETTLPADPERLHQLFSNLLDNSLKYTDPGGELVIRLACRSGHAVIDFEDSSPGVPEEQLDRLFDRLYRVEGSRSRSTGGAGLGLAICKNIVEAHGGSITALPSPLGGVLIRVSLPVFGGCP
jgi:two-component system sensor histidine kinase BaeS